MLNEPSALIVVSSSETVVSLSWIAVRLLTLSSVLNEPEIATELSFTVTSSSEID